MPAPDWLASGHTKAPEEILGGFLLFGVPVRR
jgi:hypothetical protein